jgi:uncharacterized protein YoxC
MFRLFRRNNHDIEASRQALGDIQSQSQSIENTLSTIQEMAASLSETASQAESIAGSAEEVNAKIQRSLLHFGVARNAFVIGDCQMAQALVCGFSHQTLRV